MYSLVVVYFLLAALWMPTHSLSDKEIDTIKELVDKELAARESELIKQKKSVDVHTNGHNEIIHPLGPKTTKKPVIATLKPTKRTTLHPDTNLQHSVDNCIDMIESDLCMKIIEEGEDCSKEHMILHCERSCGYCAQPSYPVDCLKTTYGCCDDMKTPKQNPKGEGCPVCADRAPLLCTPYIHDCNEIGMVGNWMRLNCQKTCEVCTSASHETKVQKVECVDDKENGKYCASWKSAKLCGVFPDMMKNYCTKTCGHC